ncbi:Hint domain-containing protein [Aliiroseovarius crassostreae]|uniref:Hint domain-containing protein n=1 Tax=Aliiroseovarius crassostreae TaxID=154981 RepID=UPI0021FC6CA6|nr:Hint domain-containing protein [Aliiroseovarius crassostreae]UWQ06186.1 Hint domain-containing protein [Aliiroseovarius crassostreae]
MATYTVEFYDTDPLFILGQTVGATVSWSGSATAAGVAIITDNETGIEGLTLDGDDGGGETATADVTLGTGSSTGASVEAEEMWTLRDTVTGEEFQVATFHVLSGGAAGYYTLSEVPLVPGRSYEVVEFDNSPDVSSGDIAFTYSDQFLGDDLVEGTSGNDVIDAGYAGDPEGDAIDDGHGSGPSGQGDEVEAGGGNDTVLAGDGDDLIYGDFGHPDTPLAAEEVLDWTDQGAQGTDLTGGFTQNTGEIDVTIGYSDPGNNATTFTVETGNTQYVGSGGYDANSAGRLYGNGDAETAVLTVDFAAATGANVTGEVSDVSFRINDLDAVAGNHIDQVTITAFDADGNPVAVNLTAGSGILVSGNTATGNGNYDTSNPEASLLVEIPGPVSQIIIEYANGDTVTHAVDITDIHFTPIPISGDDSLSGGAGNDTIYGEDGDDTLVGDAGQDHLYGGDGADLFSVGAGDVAEGGAHSDIFNLDLTAALDGSGPTITVDGGEDADDSDIDTLDLKGLVNDWSDVVFDPGNAENGTATLTDGTVVTFSNIENLIICFTRGTRIETPYGPRPVQDLRPGDLVLTRDNGVQPLRWIGSKTVAGQGDLAPVRFAKGAFGNSRALLVSPQHRMLYRGADANLLFDQSEVMIPAKHLINGRTICQEDRHEVTYYHLLFDQHEVVYCEGAASESFHPGHQGLAAISPAAREELFTLFPELRSAPNSYGQTARMVLRHHEARTLNLVA